MGIAVRTMVLFIFGIASAIGGCVSIGTANVSGKVEAKVGDIKADVTVPVSPGVTATQGPQTVSSSDPNAVNVNVTGNNNTVTVNTGDTTINTTTIVIADVVTFIDRKFTHALDASRSIIPKAITVYLPTRDLVVYGPSSDGVTGVWLYENATLSQSVQAINNQSGKFKRLAGVDVAGQINSSTLFQKVNNTSARGLLRNLDIVMDPMAPQASSSLTIQGFDGVDRRVVFPAGLLGRIVNGLEVVTQTILTSLVAMSDGEKPIAIMAKTTVGTGIEPIYCADVSELATVPGKNWKQSAACVFDKPIGDMIYASGAFRIRTTDDELYVRTKEDILSSCQ